MEQEVIAVLGALVVLVLLWHFRASVHKLLVCLVAGAFVPFPIWFFPGFAAWLAFAKDGAAIGYVCATVAAVAYLFAVLMVYLDWDT